MNSTEALVEARLRAAADRIVVDADVRDITDVQVSVRPTELTRRRTLIGVTTLAAAAALAVVAGLAVEREAADTGVAATKDTTPAPGSVAAHVESPPPWFGVPQPGFRPAGDRTGDWVSMAIGRAVDANVATPIVISVFDGTHKVLDDAQMVTVDGARFQAAQFDDWRALATIGTPTVMVTGQSDEETLTAVLKAVDVVDAGGERSLLLREMPDGFVELVPPRTLGPDEQERRTLAGGTGTVAINEVSDWSDPLLYAAGSGTDLTKVDVNGRVGWSGRTSGSAKGPLRFLVWSPESGVVFEITTTDRGRSVRDLSELAAATSVMDAAEWDARYGS